MLRRLVPPLSLALAACSSTSSPPAAAEPPLEGGTPPDAGADATQSTDASDAGSMDEDATDAAAPSCPSGTVASFDGTCVAAGIQGCAPMFVDESGLCRPSSAACPAGTIPDFATGCVPVGIDACASSFVGEDGLCRPTAAACGDGLAIPSEGCVDLDGPDGCGDGTWGAIDAAPGTIFVDPSAAAGGDGSTAKPFATIGAALAVAHSGDRIALAAGTYAEAVAPTTRVEVRGRCASKVTLTGTVASGYGDATIAVDGPKGVVVRGVTIAGKGSGVVVASGDVTVAWSRVHGVSTRGVMTIATGAAKLDHVLVDHVVKDASGLGRGLVALSGGSITATSSAVVAIAGDAVFAGAGTETLDDVGIDQNGGNGIGVGALGGGTVTATRVGIVGAHVGAVVTQDAKSSVSLERSVVFETAPDTSKVGGAGVYANAGTTISVTRSALVDDASSAAVATGKGATVSLDHALVRGTKVAGNGTAGYGAYVDGGGSLVITSSSLVANHLAAIFAGDPGTELSSTASLLEGTLPGDGDDSAGVLVYGGAHASLVGNAIVGNGVNGVRVTPSDTSSEGASADLAGNLVDGTAVGGASVGGTGVSIVSSKVAMTGDAVVDSRNAAIRGASSSLALKDVFVRHTDVDADLGLGGAALLGRESTISLDGAVFVDSATVGLVVLGASTQLDAKRVLVSGVSPGASALGGNAVPMGDGIEALYGATAKLSACRIEKAARAGLLFDESGGAIDHVTTIDDAYGLVVQGSTAPILGDGDSFTGTATNVVTSGSLPVPEATLGTPGTH